MKKTTNYQYEPLLTPKQWKDDERSFALRLTQLMDVLFDRLGRLEKRLSELENRH